MLLQDLTLFPSYGGLNLPAKFVRFNRRAVELARYAARRNSPLTEETRGFFPLK